MRYYIINKLGVMIKFRILTDSKLYAIQQKTLFGWRWYKTMSFGIVSKKLSDTYSEAKDYLQREYGKQADIEDNWIVCHR